MYSYRLLFDCAPRKVQLENKTNVLRASVKWGDVRVQLVALNDREMISVDERRAQSRVGPVHNPMCRTTFSGSAPGVYESGRWTALWHPKTL